MLSRLKSTYSRAYSIRNPSVPPNTNGNPLSKLNKELEAVPLRLSSRQITLLLSSIWAQSISPANMPENFEAIAHTYSLVLLFSRAKNSSNEALVRSFQLAFSLRDISLKEGGPLPPSRRRSLFTLSASMIIFSSIAYGIVPLVHCAKIALTERTADPFLKLVEDRKLQAVGTGSGHQTNVYGSTEDDAAALKSLSHIQFTEDQTREYCASVILKTLGSLPEPELSTVREQLLSEFLPDDVCPLGSQSFMDSPCKVYQLESRPPLLPVEDDAFADSFESQTKQNYEDIAGGVPNLLSIDQLLESVLETAHQVGRLSVSTAPDVPYKEVARHCEALLIGKQQKMSNLMSVQQKHESLRNLNLQKNNDVKMGSHFPAEMGTQNHRAGNPFLDNDHNANMQKPTTSTAALLCSTEYQHNPSFFRLPASSPYDNFLKAAAIFLLHDILRSKALGGLVLADHFIADKKIFGGTTPSTIASTEWWEETDKKFQAWPRTAGPPVVMNPISRQNFIVKSRSES
ncbi:hypothetical protein NL676_016888 [Syzygium grande]|nr:hypothetical protein NL676_016888 [Syzygium grande]